MRRRFAQSAALAFSLLVFEVWADALQNVEARVLLQRIANAAHELNFSGTVVYQHGPYMEASRIHHYVEAHTEYQRLETLDGPKREVVCTDNEVLTYFLDSRILRIEKRVLSGTFPALLPEQLDAIAENYVLRQGNPLRIAGFDAVSLTLEPRDGLRYGHKLWADAVTGLLLKARTLDEQKQIVEQVMFTQLKIGGVNRDAVRPSIRTTFPPWRLDRFDNNPLQQLESRWGVRSWPPGFRKVNELQRSRDGVPGSVIHLVYSDGLAAVSVFIEPLAGRTELATGLGRQGAINIYRRILDNNLITVLGEAPVNTVTQIGDAVFYQGK
jgi:sigma-E factor negative regulatory protein RseB